VVSHLKNALEGHETVYTPDPNSGTVVESTQPRKPGGIFRDIVLGAIIGGAAGAKAPPFSGGLGGFLTGANAVVNANQQADAARRQRVQQNAESQYLQKQRTDADNLAAASIAKHTMSSLADTGHNVGFHTQEEHDKLAASTDKVKTSALKNGGQLSQVPHNAERGNGPALMAAYNKNPQAVMQAPDGFHRIPFFEYNTSGLTYKSGQWTEADGSPVDWNKHATVTLVDLPTAAWNRTITLTKSEANSVAGYQIVKGNPHDQVSTTFGSVFGLGLKNLDNINADRKERERGPKDVNEAKEWVSAADSADPNSPDYDLIQSRAKKGQNFLDLSPDKPEKLTGEELGYKEYLDTKPAKPMTRLQFHQQWEKKPKEADEGSNSTATGEEYLATLPKGEQGIVRAIGTGHTAPDRLAYLLARNQKLLAEVTQAYPDFDSSKAKSYADAYKDFTSGKTADKITAGGVALQHLAELHDLNTSASHIPGTQAHASYMNKAETLAGELAAFYGTNTEVGIANIKKSLEATAPGNRNAAIRTQAKSMGDRMDEFEQRWTNAAPSAAYQAPMPNVSAAAKNARAALDPTYAERLQQERSGQTQQQQTRPNSQRPGPAPEGTIINTANGQRIKQSGQWVPYKGGQ